MIRALWLRICRFFFDPKFDAEMDEWDAQEQALIRRIESRRQDEP